MFSVKSRNARKLMAGAAIAGLLATVTALSASGEVPAPKFTAANAPTITGSLPAGAYQLAVTGGGTSATEVVDISGSGNAPVLMAAADNDGATVSLPMTIGAGNALHGQTAAGNGATWALNGTVSALPGTHSASGTSTFTKGASVVTMNFTLTPTTLTPMAREPKQSNGKPPKTLLQQFSDWMFGSSSSSGGATSGGSSSSGSGSTSKGLATYTPPGGH